MLQAAAQAPVVYSAQALEEYINQRLLGNLAVIEQQIATGAGYHEQMPSQVMLTDQKAEAISKKMVEDETRISQIVATANVTRDAVQLTHDKMVEMFKGVEALKADLESKIRISDEEASLANQSLRADAAQEIGKLRKELIDKFGELEAQAELKKTELQAWTAGFRIEVRDEFIRQGGVAGGERGAGSRGEGSGLKHDKKDQAVWKLADKVGKLDFRHWVEAVEINLEAIHGWSKPDKVLDLMRREDTEVNTDSLKEIVRRASAKLEEDGLEMILRRDLDLFVPGYSGT